MRPDFSWGEESTIGTDILGHRAFSSLMSKQPSGVQRDGMTASWKWQWAQVSYLI